MWPNQKLRHTQYVLQPDGTGNELNFDCFYLDIYLLLIAYKLLLIIITFNFRSSCHVDVIKQCHR